MPLSVGPGLRTVRPATTAILAGIAAGTAATATGTAVVAMVRVVTAMGTTIVEESIGVTTLPSVAVARTAPETESGTESADF